jgi:PIN domain nuclease of toxin-antitoxin system
VRLLLDTATLIYAVEAPQQLSKRAASVLQDLNNVLELSAISLVEIAIKTNLGKLKISADIASQAIVDLDLRVLPYTAEHALRLFDLPLHHADPFDRQIISQALVEGIAVITPDQMFRAYKGLKIIW